MNKGKFNKVTGIFLLLLFISMSTVGLAQTVNLKAVPEDFVQGVHDSVTINLYAKTNDVNVGISALKYEFILTDPVILDKDLHQESLTKGTGWLEDNLRDAGATFNAKIIAGFTSVFQTYTVPGSTDYVQIASVKFKVDENQTSNFSLELKCTSSVLWDTANNTPTPGNNYQFENEGANQATAIVVQVSKGFNFFAKTGVKIEMNEDAPSGENPAFALSATNSSYFESRVWDNTVNDLITIVPPQAKFIGYSLEGPDSDFGTSLITNEKGVFSINENGIFSYVPAENYNTGNEDFTVWLVASSTVINDSDITSINIKVNPVNDAPEIEIVKFWGTDDIDGELSETVTENQFLVIDLEVIDVENDSFVFDYVKLGGEDISGTFVGVLRNGAYSPGSYRFISDERLDFDWVEHPHTSAQFLLEVQVTENATVEKLSGEDSIQVDIKDLDRPQSDPIIASIGPANPKTSDDLTVLYTGSVDDDGDPITEYILWLDSENNELVTGTVLPASKTVKNETYTVEIYTVTVPYAEDTVKSTTVSASITIENSAPVAKNQSLFIQKTDDIIEAIGTITLDISDPDGEDDIDSCVLITDGTKGTVSISGKVATYTVTNLADEFYGENADSFTYEVTDIEGLTSQATVTVTYRKNPPADISVPAEPDTEYFEVNEEGEANEIVITIKAVDSLVTEPAGVQSIKWELYHENGQLKESFDAPVNQENFDDGIGAISTYTVALGYEFLHGAERLKEETYTVKVIVTDLMDAVSEESFEIKVKDSDRLPGAATDITFNPAEIRVTDTVTAEAAGAIDEDGDEITSYVYTWTSGPTTVDGNELTGQIKGQVWTVSARAITNPYSGADAEPGAEFTKEITVINTAPSAAELNIVTNEDMESDVYELPGEDLDEADTLTFSITQPENGTAVLDGNTVYYIPEEDFNGEDSFTYTVSDGEEEATATVTVTVNPVNDPPVLTAIPDAIYIVPDDMGILWEETYTISMGGGVDEETQEIADVEISVVSGAEVFDVAPYADWEGHNLTVYFTVKLDADLGTEAELLITVKDNGEEGEPHINTANKELKIVLGATPWYPIYSLPCTEHVTHQLTILEGTKVIAELIVKGDTLLPVDYYNAGNEGLPSGAEYSVELRSWTASAGVGEICLLPENAPENALVLKVPEYDIPGKAGLSVDGEGNQKTFKITAPLAASYTLIIRNNESGKERVIEQDFTPNDEGQIIPEEELSLDFYAAGDYQAWVFGTNPEGEGEESETVEFSISAPAETVFEWPKTGFTPADAANILIAESASTVDVKFTWPVHSAAESYNVIVTDSKGAHAAKTTQLTANSWTTKLNSKNNSNTYAWWVEAVDAQGKKDTSFTWSFNLVKQTAAPLISKVSASANGISLNFADFPESAIENVLYEVQYFSVDEADIKNSKWYNFMLEAGKAVGLSTSLGYGRSAPETEVNIGSAELVLALPAGVATKVGDYVLLRPFVDGKQQGSFVLYTVQ